MRQFSLDPDKERPKSGYISARYRSSSRERLKQSGQIGETIVFIRYSPAFSLPYGLLFFLILLGDLSQLEIQRPLLENLVMAIWSIELEESESGSKFVFVYIHICGQILLLFRFPISNTMSSTCILHRLEPHHCWKALSISSPLLFSVASPITPQRLLGCRGTLKSSIYLGF